MTCDCGSSTSTHLDPLDVSPSGYNLILHQVPRLFFVYPDMLLTDSISYSQKIPEYEAQTHQYSVKVIIPALTLTPSTNKTPTLVSQVELAVLSAMPTCRPLVHEQTNKLYSICTPDLTCFHLPQKGPASHYLDPPWSERRPNLAVHGPF